MLKTWLNRRFNAGSAQKAVWLAAGGLTLAVAASVLVAADFGAVTRGPAFEDLEPANGANSGCRTEVGGKEVFLRPGESVPAAQGWKSCQVYDGHLLITYAGLPATAKQAD